MQLITAYESPKVAIDANHTPNIYARFLFRLLNRADELNGTKPIGSAPGAGVGRPTAYSPPLKSELDDLWGFPALRNLS